MFTDPISPLGASAGLSRLSAINAALRQSEPDAQVALDPGNGKMRVLTVLSPEEVLRLLRTLGEAVELPGEETGVMAGGGSCGCGCGRR
ncbi:hypothetical protein [Pseudoxanthomonas suwonensis]|uniref:Uncharacterized protein n=1 Tax=Pseudoxanthomonas suwonensis TaxID=314722 RepID=A0A0E3Z074_9GAMM|nr:hypothetical protein [Pseudoxanthomonas suwonensis]AKC86357.1 hypothetical protein WQ53_05805 [Pseudoxanthomonas suwonensis]